MHQYDFIHRRILHTHSSALLSQGLLLSEGIQEFSTPFANLPCFANERTFFGNETSLGLLSRSANQSRIGASHRLDDETLIFISLRVHCLLTVIVIVVVEEGLVPLLCAYTT